MIQTLVLTLLKRKTYYLQNALLLGVPIHKISTVLDRKIPWFSTG